MPRNRAESARFPRDKTTFQRGQATLRRETLRSASGSDAGENTRARRAARRRPGRRRRLEFRCDAFGGDIWKEKTRIFYFSRRR